MESLRLFGSVSIASLRDYGRHGLRDDSVAALVVWASLVPAALAFAAVAGVPGWVGLVSVVPGLALYALFGGSNQLVMSPVALIAVISAAIVGPRAGGDGFRYLAMTSALAMLVGVLLSLVAVLRWSFIATFVPESVLLGLSVGLGIAICIGQLPALLGMEQPTDGNSLQQVRRVLSHLSEIDTGAALIGGLGLVVMICVRRWVPVVPSALLAVLIGVGCGHLFGIGIGNPDPFAAIPGKALRIGPPSVGLHDYADMLVPAIGLALVSLASTFRSPTPGDAAPKVSSNREVVALAAANLGSGLISGMIVSGTTASVICGRRTHFSTRIGGLFVAVSTVFALPFASPILTALPRTVPAAIAVVLVGALIGPAALRLFRARPFDSDHADRRIAWIEFAAAVVVGTVTVALGVLAGLVATVGLSALLLLVGSAHPNVVRVPAERATDPIPFAPAGPGITVARLASPLHFANAEFVRDRIMAICSVAEPRIVVLDAMATGSVDVSAAQMLTGLHTELASAGIQLRIAHPEGSVRSALDEWSFTSETLRVYASLEEALS